MTGVSSLMGFHHLRQLGLDVPEKFKWGGSRNGQDNGQKQGFQNQHQQDLQQSLQQNSSNNCSYKLSSQYFFQSLNPFLILDYNSAMQGDKQPLASSEGIQEKQQPQESHKKQEKHHNLISETTSKEELRMELESMAFQGHLIEQALATSSNLEQAIETIISIMEAQEQQEIQKQEEIQLILLVRMDLKMGNGKIAAQCAHAILRAFKIGRAKTEVDSPFACTFIEWLQKGKKQVFYRVEDQSQLFSILNQCQLAGALTTYIRDAGRTQIAAGSATVGAIGPISSTTMKPLTKDLHLL